MAEAARKITYYDDYSANEKIETAKKPIKRVKSASNKKIKFLYAGFCIISVFLSIFILSNYAQITSLNVEINKTNAIINELKKTETSLIAKVEELKSNSDIVYEAQTKLGMVFPEKEQIVYFSLNQALPENETFIARIVSILTGKIE